MSQITGALTINNGAATPVAKSFAPERVAPEASVFTERSAAASAGFTKLAIRFSAASSKRATNRIDVDLDYPVLATVNGVNSVAYVGRFRGYFVAPDVMTAAERADLHAFVANALNHATIKAVVKDLDPMY
jgi:hypothetical protein